MKAGNADWSIWEAPVLTEEELVQQYTGEIIMIDYEMQSLEARDRLVRKGIPRENIFVRMEESEANTFYLNYDFMVAGSHEVFVDGGAYLLENTLEFINWCKGDFDHVYAFEPDPKNASRCRDILANHKDSKKISLEESCTWSSDTNLSFRKVESYFSSVSDKGNVMVPARSIDSVLKGARATLIKLDVEGAEMQTLIGAANTIRRYRPRLAIAIYHRDEDIVDIPLYVQQLVPDYKFYLRHNSSLLYDTCLYCI